MLKIILPKIHINIEKWKFSDKYGIYVSNLGRFKNLNKEEIKLKISKNGYLQIPYCNNKNGTIKYLQAHRVVMEIWCPLVNMWKDKLTVDHKDHNKRNNSYRNLEWVTKSDNQKRANEDLLEDEKDKEIDRLKSIIESQNKKIEHLISNSDSNIIIRAGINKFYSWTEVREFLITKSFGAFKDKSLSYTEAKVKRSIRRNEKYFGFDWKIQEK